MNYLMFIICSQNYLIKPRYRSTVVLVTDQNKEVYGQYHHTTVAKNFCHKIIYLCVLRKKSLQNQNNVMGKGGALLNTNISLPVSLFQQPHHMCFLISLQITQNKKKICETELNFSCSMMCKCHDSDSSWTET